MYPAACCTCKELIFTCYILYEHLCRKTLVQQDAEESLRAILSALEAESSDVLSKAFPHAPADQVCCFCCNSAGAQATLPQVFADSHKWLPT